MRNTTGKQRVRAVAILVGLSVWGVSDGGAELAVGPAPAATAAAAPGGIWVGSAWIGLAQVKTPARGLMAADGSSFFLVRNTVLRSTLSPLASTTLAMLYGAPVVGTPVDAAVFSSARPHYVRALRQPLSLDVRWCPAPQLDPDICMVTGFNRMLVAYDNAYESGSSLARIAGHYRDTRGRYTGVLSIAGDGYVFMQDPATGCVVNGRVALIKPAYSIYSIKLSYASCRSAAFANATFTGLVSYNGNTRKLFALMQGTAVGTTAGNMLDFTRQ